MQSASKKRQSKRIKNKVRRYFLGSADKRGLLSNLCTYGILTGLGFVFVYPLIYMLSVSFMDTKDLVDSTVTWIPNRLSLESFSRAGNTLEISGAIWDSLKMTVLPAFLQTASLALAGYGLGRYPVPLKKLWIALAVLVFLIPAQVIVIPRFLLFNSQGMIGTVLPTYLISILGQGIKSSVFLLVYFQFFSTYPRALDEAAQIDGAGRFRIFAKIALPMAMPAVVVCFLFSFIWIWNDTTTFTQFSEGAAITLPMRLQMFVERFNRIYSSSNVSTGGALNESIRLAGTLLTILPLIAIYLVLQKQFVESIERSGITGE
jgi:multiple sugar transport system permease protein